MHRRKFLTRVLAVGAAASASPAAVPLLLRAAENAANENGVVISTTKLQPPANGTIRVGIPISQGTTVIDFAGPWDAFRSVMVPDRGSSMEDQMPFQLVMISNNLEPVTVEGEMKLVPHYTFANVPECKVVVVPAQKGSEEMRQWLRKMEPTTDVMMSVCVGVMHLAKAGLLDGKSATIHHDHYDRFAKEYPRIDVKRGVRFVENEKISTSGGETCGIDLALRVIERYFGHAVAARTADYMEYQGKGWII